MAKVISTIATITVETGYEWWPGWLWPYHHSFVNADGRALVIYHYRLGANLIFAYRYSDPTRASWSAEQLILSVAPGFWSYLYDQMCACVDASGNIHVAMEYYFSGSSTTIIRYVKLTKVGGGGWSTGTVRQAWLGATDGAGHTRGLTISHDATYIFIGAYLYDYSTSGVLHSTDGISWYWIGLIGTTLDWGSPNYVASRAGVTMYIGIIGGATRKIQVRVGTGLSFAAAVDIWTGSTLVSDIHDNTWYGAHALYIGHANADWLIIARLEDGSQRIKKYKAGWIGGEVIVKASGTVQRQTQAVWDAARGLLYIWYSNVAAPQTYDPATDAVAGTGLDTPMVQMFEVLADEISAVGFQSAGAGGSSTLSWAEELTGEIFNRTIPIQYFSQLTYDRVVPLYHQLAMAFNRVIPLAFDDALEKFNRGIPLHHRKLVDFDRVIPLLYSTSGVQTFDRTVPLAFSAERVFDRTIPLQHSRFEHWVTAGVDGDAWVKDGAIADAWVKDAAIADGWVKV